MCAPYIWVMARSPKETIKVRRLPKVGDTITIKATVTRIGRNTWDTADTLTVRIPGHDVPVTAPAEYLLGKDEQSRAHFDPAPQEREGARRRCRKSRVDAGRGSEARRARPWRRREGHKAAKVGRDKPKSVR